MVQKRKLQDRQRALAEAINLVYTGEHSKAIRLVKKHFTVKDYRYLFLKGWVEQLQGNHVKAISWLEKSLRKDPTNVDALEGLVVSYLQLKHFPFALECAEQLIVLEKDNPKYLFLLATVKSQYYRGDKDKLAHVIKDFSCAYDAAIEEKDIVLLKDILIGWGACLVDLRSFEEAKIVLEAVKSQDPNNFILHKNLASAYAGLNLIHEAIESCNIAKQSDDKTIATDALYQLGMLHLSLGDYRSGWRLHEFRHDIKEFDYRPTSTLPMWDGKVLKDESILLYQEQGLGDTIQFSRYIPEVKKRVKSIDLLINPNTYVSWEDNSKEPNSLKQLLKENYLEIDNIYIKGWDIIPYSKYNSMCSLMSLPRVFKTTLSNIPSIPYLKTKNSIGLEMHDIGIFWKGSAAHANDSNRSIPTALINSFIERNKDKTFVSLQLDRDEELLDYPNVTRAKEYINDFTDTLSALTRCRVIITVDSMIAHLAGSANVPTILLHAHSPDWRWLQDRRDSPWYPSIINLRQDTSKSWSTVLDSTQQEINALFENEILID